jgi:hypothetical protein
MLTETIKQRTETDCMICCLAMATGLSYEYIVEKFGPMYKKLVDKRGVEDSEDPLILEILGYKKDVDYLQLSYSPNWGQWVL